MMVRTIELIIPNNFMNTAVTISNDFTADTNDSANWDTLKFPLPEPKGKWEIYSIKNKSVLLIDNPKS